MRTRLRGERVTLTRSKDTAPRVFNKRHNDAPTGSVYVGRPSRFGNPFKVLHRDSFAERQNCIEDFKKWLLHTPAGRRVDALARKELRGKNLVCWCAPLPCHASVLLEIANQ